MLLGAARAHAALYGRDHVLPDDVKALAQAVLAHRLQAGWDDADAGAEVIDEALREVSAT
jgi:MoxR-like ATPase